MDNIIKSIEEYWEDKNIAKKVMSLYAPNGTGKTRLSKELGYYFCNKKTYVNATEPLTREMELSTPYQNEWENKHDWKGIFLHELVLTKNALLLPSNLFFKVTENSFSYELSFSQIINTLNKIGEPHQTIKTVYEKYEKILPESYVTFDNILMTEDVLVFNSTDLQSLDIMKGRTRIESLAIVIEYLASAMKIKIVSMLNHMSKINYFEFKNVMKTVLYSKYSHVIADKIIELADDSNFRLLFEKKYNHLLLMLINFAEMHSISKEDRVEIEKYNEIMIKIFQKAKEKLFYHLPYKFKEIYLNKRYNASLGVHMYDLKIINNENKVFYSFNFLNNIGSEGEKKLVNTVNLIIQLMSIENNEKFLLLSDDAFDSFDHANYSSIFKLIAELLENKKCFFLHLTHNYELFRVFNKRFTVKPENTLLMNRNSNNEFVFTIFPIYKDYYKNYIPNAIKKINDEEINGDYKKFILLVTIIPYYRNIIEIIDGDDSLKYMLATNLLHHKKNDTGVLEFLLDEKLFKDCFFKTDENEKERKLKEFKTFLLDNPDYAKLLEKAYQYLLNSDEDFNKLENRMFLSLYARIIIEEFIANSLNLNLIKNPPSANQTGVLIKKLKNYYNTNNTLLKNIMNSIENLNNYIPDYIHTNYNEISYLIGLDMNNLMKGIKDFKDSIFLYRKELEEIEETK